MRLIVDVLVALMVAAILAGAVVYTHHDRTDDRAVGHVHDEVQRFQRQVTLQAALEHEPRTDRGYPTTIDPDWFSGDLPENPLLPPDHPWVEIAAEADHELEHPRQLVAIDRSVARFWYNPGRGIVRARVPLGLSDTATLEMYNRANGCHLGSLYPAP